MADVNFFDHFEMPWAQNGEVEAIQDNQYKQGWAYIGAVPPSVEQFNKVQQLSDEKTAWLFAQVKKLAEQGGYALTATMVDALTTGIAASMQAGVGVIGTDTGAANAYVVNFAPAITQLKDGMALWFKVKTANTGASTLNVNGLGARAIVGLGHTALQGGELVVNGKALVVWKADTNSWVLFACTGGATQLPSGSYGVTPALFDDSRRLCTTQFLQRNGVRFSPQTRYYGGTAELALSNTDIGAKISFNANADQRAKLPPTAGLPIGSTIFVSRGGNYLATISTDDGTAKIDGQAGSLLVSIELRSGEEVALTWTGAVWLCSGTYSFRISQFGSSLSATGWKRVGDILIQWGHVDSGSATTGTITFPIAFPTACRSVVAHDYGATASDVSNVRLAPPTKTSVGWVGQTFQAQPSVPGVWTWQAIGD